jgi:alkanesulfonate monooxygenase SsuD/methylene tetrahydromethanopterin reductase-like flavin-dependent oxidoreductase (luciferase family)
VNFGIIFANVGAYVDPDAAIIMGQSAEANGFESIWTVEHPAVPKGYVSEYPYSRDGRMPGDEMAPVPDPLAWLTWVGAHTKTIKLATGVMILPLRNPVVLAKECATDSINALRALWTQETSSYSGSHSSFADIYSFPKPAQGSIPIVIGGHSKPAARRAGRFGDGFFPADPRHLVELLPVMRAAAVEAGRDPDTIEITTGGRPKLDELKMLADIGVTRFVVPPLAMHPKKLPEAMEKFAEDIISKF